jgi:type I restriction enzyme S subunit
VSIRFVQLSDVCDLQNGFAFKSTDYVEKSNTCNIRMSNIRPGGSFNEFHNQRYLPDSYANEYKDYLLKDGDLIIAMTDMATETKILGLPTLVNNTTGRNFLLNQRVGKLCKFSSEIYVPYLRHILTAQEVIDYYKSKGAGGLQINISKKDILSVKFPLPSLPAQNKIVAKLDAIFAEIDIAIAAAEANAKNAEALFQSYLTEVFERGGEGWERKTIEEITDKTKNVSPDKSPDLEFTYVDVSSISNTSYSIISTQKLLGKDAPSRAKKNIIANDILFATVRPTLKRIAIVPEFLENQVASTGYVVLRTNKKNYHKFLFYFLFTSTFNEAMETLQRGASYPAVTDSDVKLQKLLVPSYEEQYKISEKLERINSSISIKINSELRKIKELNSLKQSILQKAFSGELVKD